MLRFKTITRHMQGAVFLGSLLAVAPLAQASLINLDFQFDPTDTTSISSAFSSYTFNGQGGMAGAGDVWNGLNAAVGSITFNRRIGLFADITTPMTTGPLLDSTGAVTSTTVTLDAGNLRGVFAAADSNLGNFATDALDLMREYLVAYGTGSSSLSIDNLTPGVSYNLALYGAGDRDFRNTTFTTSVGTKSTSPVADAHLLTEGVDFVKFQRVKADASGTIRVDYSNGPGNNEAGINGLQIREVPEPISLALFSIGLAGLGMSRRKKA